ncbi:hypothetical protein O181_050735 [Austropuccinia psidii MF-1]|uniref:Uncharacterized protein n=1 Tax=Austropuccinia psidii MF-1 TaxID=1389203 RepID=A0A9Q3DVW0_9BASI|nr:hypothetical protein [Austropuccinia psidii MF-1]
MLSDKHTRNDCLLSDPSDHTARGVPNQDSLTRTPLFPTMMKAFPSGNGLQDPKQADRSNSRQLSKSPQVLICPPPLLGHHPMVTLLLDRSKVIIWPMKDGDEQNQPNPPQQDSPVPSLPHKQTPRQPTPGPSGTQWLEDLFREPSQTDEPPIPGLSPSSKLHENVLTSCPTPPHSVITIDDIPVGSPPPLIPTMRLTRNLPTYDQP